MKKFLSLALFIISAVVAWGGKPTVYVENFSNPQNYNEAWIQMVRSSVIEAIANSHRATLVDAVTEETRMNEELRRMKDNISTSDLETTKALEILGSHLILNGDVSSFTITESTLDSGTKSFSASVTFTLKVVNAFDGQVMTTETFTFPKQGFMGVGALGDSLTKAVMETADAAVAGLKKNITGGLKKFIDKAFPMTGAVEAVDEVKGKEAKTVYISIGSRDGVAKGNKFEVRAEKKIGPKTVFKTIGEVEVAEVDDEMSLCKVKKGGVDINDALSAGIPVIVRTPEK